MEASVSVDRTVLLVRGTIKEYYCTTNDKECFTNANPMPFSFARFFRSWEIQK